MGRWGGGGFIGSGIVDKSEIRGALLEIDKRNMTDSHRRRSLEYMTRVIIRFSRSSGHMSPENE